jgi:hypothetical protein
VSDSFRPVFEGMKQVADGLILANQGVKQLADAGIFIPGWHPLEVILKSLNVAPVNGRVTQQNTEVAFPWTSALTARTPRKNSS